MSHCQWQKPPVLWHFSKSALTVEHCSSPAKASNVLKMQVLSSKLYILSMNKVLLIYWLNIEKYGSEYLLVWLYHRVLSHGIIRGFEFFNKTTNLPNASQSSALTINMDKARVSYVLVRSNTPMHPVDIRLAEAFLTQCSLLNISVREMGECTIWKVNYKLVLYTVFLNRKSGLPQCLDRQISLGWLFCPWQLLVTNLFLSLFQHMSLSLYFLIPTQLRRAMIVDPPQVNPLQYKMCESLGVGFLTP